MDSEHYKRLYELTETIRKSDAALAEGRENLWREACRALLSASTRNTAASWREACRRLFRLANEQTETIFMLNGIIEKRNEIEDASRNEIKAARALDIHRDYVMKTAFDFTENKAMRTAE